MERVAVVGSGGAGKSTFSRALGQLTGLPVIHLDERFWKPGWVETERDQWIADQAAFLRGDRWIADGNYGGTFESRFARADTVIVLALPAVTCVRRALVRSLKNRGCAVQAAGCPERVDTKFLTWIWRYNRNRRPRLDAALDRHRHHMSIIELRSSREIRRLLAVVAETA